MLIYSISKQKEDCCSNRINYSKHIDTVDINTLKTKDIKKDGAEGLSLQAIMH